MLNAEKLTKKDFPIFENKNIIYLDNAATTQNSALNAIVFLYKEVLKKEIGHKNIETTMIYTHVVNKVKGVKSPLD